MYTWAVNIQNGIEAPDSTYCLAPLTVAAASGVVVRLGTTGGMQTGAGVCAGGRGEFLCDDPAWRGFDEKRTCPGGGWGRGGGSERENRGCRVKVYTHTHTLEGAERH